MRPAPPRAAPRRAAALGPGRDARKGSLVVRLALALAFAFSASAARPQAGHADQAAAPSMAEATSAFAELRYDDALRLLDQLWRQGTSGPEQLRRIFELSGRAAGVIGEAEAARTWFSRWLSLEPGAALPEGTSPKLTEFLTEARARLGGTQLDVRATRRSGGSEVKVARLADPAALVVAIRADAARVPIETASLTTSARQLELLDRYGNVVAVVPIVDASAGSAIASAAPTSWYARWTTWAITAGVAAAASGVSLALAARADARLDELAGSSAEHDFAEVEAEERSLDRAQWVARIGLGAAVASATVAAILYLREDDSGPTIAASPDGVALSWSLAF